jgi:hypothetical protein
MPSCRLLRNSFFTLFFTAFVTAALEFGYLVWQLDTLANTWSNHSWGYSPRAITWLATVAGVSAFLVAWHVFLVYNAYYYFEMGLPESQVRLHRRGVALVTLRVVVGAVTAAAAVYWTSAGTPVHDVFVATVIWHIGCAAWVVCLRASARLAYGRTFGARVSNRALDVLFEDGRHVSSDSERNNEFLDGGSPRTDVRRRAAMSDLWSAL